MPDTTLSDAIKEAYASSPKIPSVHTLEFRHESLTEPIRLALWNSNWTASLEADAPANPGETVTFAAYRFDFKKARVTSEGVMVMDITIDNISRVIGQSLTAATQSATPVEMTYREYLSNDPTAPQNDPPTTLEVVDATADLMLVTITCGVESLMNRKFPYEVYTAEKYPGLVNQ